MKTCWVSQTYEDIERIKTVKICKNKVFRQRGMILDMAEALLPTGLAVNTGIGLLNPFGGAEGYKAAIPSEEDPNKTNNVIAEVAAKYILGRTGNLLPWDEFKKVRPDVSKDEYMRYKAFKFDKDGDINPFDDGQMTFHLGFLKYNKRRYPWSRSSVPW